jgi:hypothetical protein
MERDLAVPLELIPVAMVHLVVVDQAVLMALYDTVEITAEAEAAPSFRLKWVMELAARYELFGVPEEHSPLLTQQTYNYGN